MDLPESLRMSIDTLRTHKLRSFLTTLGIIIGITAVLTNVAVVQGFSSFFEEQVKGLGADFVNIQAGENQDFDEHIYQSLSSNANLEGATGSRNGQVMVEYLGETKTVFVSAVRPGYFDVRGLEILRGSPLGHQDKYVAVVGKSMAENDFDKPILEMSTIRITLRNDGQTEITKKFKVKGISEDPNEFSPVQPGLYIPISTLNDITDQDGYSSISLFALSDDLVDSVKSETIETLDRLLKVQPKTSIKKEEKEDQPEMMGGPQEAEDFGEEREKYTVITQKDVLDFVNEISATINLIFIGIASISLLVGGIGIANIMIVSVTERTREIGVMKAVGAENLEILTLFLLEAGMIGLLGGIIGLIFAFIISQTFVPVLVNVQGVIPLEWIALSLGVSLLIGIISGLYPASRASKLDPVEALSYE